MDQDISCWIRREGKTGRMGRKAQVEIIGLLIIVVMISFILLFVVSSMLGGDDDTFGDFRKEDLQSALIGAMLETSVPECQKNTDLRQLLIDCAKSPATGGTSRYSCQDGTGSCGHAAYVIKEVFNGTLDSWNEAYEFKVCTSTGDTYIESLYFKGGEIRASKKGIANPYTLPLGQGSSINIWLCLGGCSPVLSC